MKKLVRKGLVLFVVLALMLSVCSCGETSSNSTSNDTSSNSASSDSSSNGKVYDSIDAFNYEDVEGGIAVTSFKNYDFIEYDKIIIPNEIEGKKVVGIGFLNREQSGFGAIVGKCEVVIPDTVTYIGNYAFELCKGLIKLSGAKNCTKIGEWAFMDCENLEEITFFDNIKEIGDAAFIGCDKWLAKHPECKNW